jgi:hypothetical protein
MSDFDDAWSVAAPLLNRCCLVSRAMHGIGGAGAVLDLAGTRLKNQEAGIFLFVLGDPSTPRPAYHELVDAFKLHTQGTGRKLVLTHGSSC